MSTKQFSEYDALIGNKVDLLDIAIVDDKSSTSYKDLNRDIINFSVTLAEGGVREGDRVGIILSNSMEYIISYFAISYLGGIVVPIDFSSQSNTINKIFTNCKINTVITTKDKYNHLFRNETYGCPHFILLSENNLSTVNTNNLSHIKSLNLDPKVSLIIHTTGTTGESKGVMLSTSGVINAAKSINEYMKTGNRPVELISMPLSRSFGLARLRCVLLLGGTIILNHGLTNPAIFIKKILDHNVKGFGLVAAGIILLKTRFSQYLMDLSKHLDYIELGSSYLSASEKLELQKLLPDTNIFMHYGLTEASRSVFLNFKDTAKLESIGKPLPSVRIKIFDKSRTELKCGEVGNIGISSPWVMEGYLGLDREEHFSGDFFISDDLGMISEDNFLHYISRESEIINFGGYKFSPLEVENEINSNEKVIKSCVVLMENKTSKTIAFVESTYPCKKAANEIKENCKLVLDDYKIPKEIVFVDKILTTESGKIQRKLMMENYVEKNN